MFKGNWLKLEMKKVKLKSRKEYKSIEKNLQRKESYIQKGVYN